PAGSSASTTSAPSSSPPARCVTPSSAHAKPPTRRSRPCPACPTRSTGGRWSRSPASPSTAAPETRVDSGIPRAYVSAISMSGPRRQSRSLPRCPALALCLLVGLAARAEPACDPEAATNGAGLRALAEFPLGVAVPGAPWPHDLLASPERQALVERHFNSITAENIMKMAYLQPAPGRFTFEHADGLVDYAREHGMLAHGHTLVWHRQAPRWMNRYEGSRDDFIELLRTHVATVAAHFAGRLESWDVVNEAFDDGDPPDWRRTIWWENIGPEYVEIAFRAARAADPHAALYYNDYNISGAHGPAKLDRVLVMVDDFLARGVPIDGVGF